MKQSQINQYLLLTIRVWMLCSLVFSQFGAALQPVFAAGSEPSTTSITADNPDPSAIGETVIVSVTVSGGGGTPTGTVDITGTDADCTITLAGGSGNCDVIFSSSGEKTLNATYNGDDTYDLSSDAATHTVSEPPANNPPEITEGDPTSVTMDVNGSPIAFALTLNATDIDPGDTLTWSINPPGASNGTADVSGTPTGTSEDISYSPNLDYVGLDSFVVQVDDGNGGTDTLTVDVSIYYAPNLVSRLGNNWVEAYDWPDGAELTLTIDPVNPSDPEYSPGTQFAQLNNPLDPFSGTYATFELGSAYTLQPGDLVTVTGGGGGGRSASMTVADIQVTDLDLDNDTVSGTAGTGIDEVSVRLWSSPEDRVRVAPAAGTWIADFHDDLPGCDPVTKPQDCSYDLKPGDYGVARWWDSNGFMTSDYWEIPNLSFSARFPEKQVHGYGWALGSDVTLSIDDPDYGDREDYIATMTVVEAPWDPSQTFAQFTLDDQPGFELQPGQIVSMSGAINGVTVTKVHIVSSLAVTEINVTTDIITGTVEADSPVEVDANCGGSGCGASQSVTATGVNWSADFSAISGGDLEPGSSGEVRAPDSDGDATTVQWRILNPYIEASAKDNWIHAREWSTGTVMKLEIDDLSNGLGSADYTTTATMGQAPWNPGDPNDIVADFDMGSFTLAAGDVISVSENIVSPLVTKVLTVSPLQVTNFNVVANTISGEATAGVAIEICVNTPGNCISRTETADLVTGMWTANFNPDHDLQPDDNGWAAEYDNDADRTWYDWNVPNPYIEASARSNWVHAREWDTGKELKLEVDDPVTGPGVDYAITAIVEHNPDNPDDPNDIRADFDLSGNTEYPNGITLKAGDELTVFENIVTPPVTKVLTISALQITSYNLAENTVSGEATAGRDVEICLNQPGNCISRIETADPITGMWTADFDPDHTLVLRDNGWAAERDDEADQTWVDWNIADPRFTVQPDHSWVDGQDWTPGNTIYLTVDDDLDPLNGTCYEADQSVDGGGSFHFNVNPGDCDLQPDQYVTLDDGLTTKSTQITEVHFDAINVSTDIATGTGPAGKTANVYVRSNTGEADLDITTGTGAWEADFSGVLDIQTIQDANIQVFDADGDATMAHLLIPSFNVRANVDQLEANNWPLHSFLTVKVYESGLEIGQPDYESPSPVEVTGYASWDPSMTYLWIDLSGEIDLQPGYLVTVSDGTTTKKTIVTVLSFTDVDGNIVSGIATPATPGTEVNVWICDESSCNYNRHVTANAITGIWEADFGNVGTQPDEQTTFVIVPGTWIDSSENESGAEVDGDSTMFGATIQETYTVSGALGANGADANVAFTGGSTTADGAGNYSFAADLAWTGAITPSKTGHTFSPTAITVSNHLFSDLPNQDFNATINTYTVTYNGNGNTGGTAPTDASSPYNYNTTVTVLGNTGALVKTGYTFSGWNTQANGLGTNYNPTDTFSITANTILYAKWTINTYTVTYNGNGNTGGTAPTDASSPYNYNTTVTVLGNTGALVKTGYTFSGWNTQANGLGTNYNPADTFSITANTTLYARWTINTYTVTYDGNGNTGGSAPTDASSPYNYNTTVTVLGNTGALVKTGYTFSGWNTQANGLGANYSPTDTFSITANTTLYARWTINTYTVSGNAGVGGATLTYTSGSTTADGSGNYYFSVNHGWTGMITPSKTGYIFLPPSITISTPVTANLSGQNFTATATDTTDDVAVYRRAAGGAYWLNYNFATASFTNYLSFGDGGTTATCYPVAMDFDGDGIDEPTHLCGGGWHFFESNGSFVKSIFAYMQPGDIPVPGDYNGDGKDEVAVYRRTTGGAYWLFYDFATASFTNYVSLGDGGSSATCYPAAMDFDGDGVDELTHLCGGGWHFFETNGSFVKSIYTYMQPGDIPAPGDYNGDGTDDVAVYRRSTGGGYWLNYNFSTASFTDYLSLGDGGTTAACYPAAMDFDGDGSDERTHLCGGGWHFFESNGSFVKSIFAYMQVGDKPVPGKYGN